MKKNRDRFCGFIAAEVSEPHAEWSRLYDMKWKIIWINTAAKEGNNVVKIIPEKW